jgi:hypothetical protein
MTSRSLAALRHRVRPHRVAIGLVATFFLVGVAWLVSNPPGAAPDEDSHYVRMVGLSYGHPLGGSLPQDADLGPTFNHFVGDARARLTAEAGSFWLPGSAPPPHPCNAFRADQPYDCAPPPTTAGHIHAISMHARTLPGSYLLPAALSRLAHSTNGKLYLGRFGYLLQDTALWALAVIAARRRLGRQRPEVYAALILSFTPLLAFQMGQLSPTGTEAMAVLAFTTWLLDALVAPDRARVWGVCVLAGVAAWSRDLGVPLVLAIAVIIAVVCRNQVRTLGRRVGAWALLPVAGAVVATAGAVTWRLALQYPIGSPNATLVRVRAALTSLKSIVPDSVGLVGWLDVQADPLVRRLWAIALAGVVIRLALRRFGWALTVGVFAAFYVALNVYLRLVLTTIGFGVQPRYTVVLAGVAVLVASAAFPVAAATGRNVVGRVALVGAALFAAIGHASMYLVNAQRHAHGLNASPISFRHTAWHPPVGWPASLGLCALACLCVAALPLVIRTLRPAC